MHLARVVVQKVTLGPGERFPEFDDIKDAIFEVDEPTALRNLKALGCDIQTAPPEFKRRKGE